MTLEMPRGRVVSGFNRRSFIGFKGPAGSLSFGRDYTAGYYAAYVADIFHLGMLGNLQSILQPAGGAEGFGRVSDGIFYASPVWAGLHVRATYSPGSRGADNADPAPAGSHEFASLGVHYQHERLALVGGYQVLKQPQVDAASGRWSERLSRREDSFLGLRYGVGNFTVSAGHWGSRQTLDASNLWLGGAYTQGASTWMAQVQRLRQDSLAGPESRATIVGLGYSHALSRRSTLYASYGKTHNNANAAFLLVGADVGIGPSAPGASPSALGFGIRHAF